MLIFNCSNHNTAREAKVQFLCDCILRAKLVKGDNMRNRCPFCDSDIVHTHKLDEERTEASLMQKIRHNSNCCYLVAEALRIGLKKEEMRGRYAHKVVR